VTVTVTFPPIGVPAVTLTDGFDGAADAAPAVMARSEALRSNANPCQIRRDVSNRWTSDPSGAGDGCRPTAEHKGCGGRRSSRGLDRAERRDTAKSAAACEDDVVLRSVTLGLAMSVLSAACALVEPPVTAGTATVQVEVRNASRDLVELVVNTDTGERPGAVQPASVAPGSSTDVFLSIPSDQAWTLDVEPFGWSIESWAFEALLDQGCEIVLKLWADSGRNLACAG
jgi:hypothetical protein